MNFFSPFCLSTELRASEEVFHLVRFFRPGLVGLSLRRQFSAFESFPGRLKQRSPTNMNYVTFYSFSLSRILFYRLCFLCQNCRFFWIAIEVIHPIRFIDNFGQLGKLCFLTVQFQDRLGPDLTTKTIFFCYL